MSPRAKGLAAFVVVLLSVLPEISVAGGYSLAPRGARSLGRGGAFAAGPTDLSAAWLNPAALANLRGVQVLADLGVGFWSVAFERAADPAIAPEGFARVENMAPPAVSPSVLVGWDFGLDGLQATLGVYGPYAGDLGFDSIGPQRYSLVYLDMFDASYQLAVAARPLRWLAIGAAFQLRDLRMTQAVKLTAYTGFDPLGPPESRSDDILAEIRVASHFNPSGLFGVWLSPAEWIELGLSVLLPMHVRLPGSVRVTLPDDNPLFRNAWLDGDDVTVVLDAATVVRAGVALRLPRRFEVELDAWVEVWEPHRDIVLEVGDVTLRDIEGGMDIPMRDMTVPQDWHSSFGLAAGAEWEAIGERLHVRAGLFYDSGAVPDHTLSVAWLDSHKVGIAAGLSVELWRFAFDLAYAHVFFLPRTVEDSVVRQLNPLEPQEPELLSVVGNGRYESGLDLLALTVRAAF